MMGLGEIVAANRDATERAAAKHKQPWQPSPEERAAMARGEQPATTRLDYFGDYVPDGWARATDEDGDELPALFVDKWGDGAPATDERGTPNLREALRRLAADPDGTAYAVTEHGQFQAYVARYVRA